MAQCFHEFAIRHTIMRIFSQKFRTVRNGRGFTRRDNKMFITKINISVIFNVFIKFLGDKNLELYSSILLILFQASVQKYSTCIYVIYISLLFEWFKCCLFFLVVVYMFVLPAPPTPVT